MRRRTDNTITLTVLLFVKKAPNPFLFSQRESWASCCVREDTEC